MWNARNWIRKRGLIFCLFLLLGAGLFAQEGLEEVLREAGIPESRIVRVLEVAPSEAWEQLDPREIAMTLPALAVAARRGVLPNDPAELERMVRESVNEAARLSALGFTQREVATTLARARRQARVTGRPEASRGASEEALRHAERNRARREIRQTQRETARSRARTPGNAGKVPRRPETPPGGGTENKPN